MENICIFPVGSGSACRFAWENLAKEGVRIVDHPSPEVSHLLLDCPSFGPDGQLRGGGDIGCTLEMLPENVCVIGGLLNHPALNGYRKLDLLRDEGYLAKNAVITADCALRVAAPRLQTTFRDCPTLILGWGRIGKCLGQMLKVLGCPVTVAARKERDLGMLEALGYEAVDFTGAAEILPETGLIFNTVPGHILETAVFEGVKVDLASVRGLEGEDVVWARGLPGRYAPESSGRLIAETILRKLKEGQL